MPIMHWKDGCSAGWPLRRDVRRNIRIQEKQQHDVEWSYAHHALEGDDPSELTSDKIFELNKKQAHELQWSYAHYATGGTPVRADGSSNITSDAKSKFNKNQNTTWSGRMPIIPLRDACPGGGPPEITSDAMFSHNTA